MKKAIAWILAIAGAILFFLFGKNFFADDQNRRAWEKYKKDKENFDKKRAELENADKKDEAAIKELERQKAEAEKKFLKRAAESKEEAKKVNDMNAEDLADFTSKKEEELRKRLGL